MMVTRPRSERRGLSFPSLHVPFQMCQRFGCCRARRQWRANILAGWLANLPLRPNKNLYVIGIKQAGFAQLHERQAPVAHRSHRSRARDAELIRNLLGGQEAHGRQNARAEGSTFWQAPENDPTLPSNETVPVRRSNRIFGWLTRFTITFPEMYSSLITRSFTSNQPPSPPCAGGRKRRGTRAFATPPAKLKSS